MKMKLVRGVGVNDVNENLSNHTEYMIWSAMLQRCYDYKIHKIRPTYIGCTVCDEWKYFSNFKNWFYLNYKEGFHLDKDILVEGNKIYSPDTCRFVPPYLNMLLTEHGRARGDLPLGISKNRGSYRAKCCDGKGRALYKYGTSIDKLLIWYSETKTRIVSEVAQKALDAGDIQQDIFDALVSRKF